MNQLERIQHMEQILDEASEALKQLMDAFERYQALKSRIAELEAYYTPHCGGGIMKMTALAGFRKI